MRVVAKLVEIERDVEPSDPAVYFEYEKWFVNDLLTYMKNNYYLKLAMTF